MFGQHIEIRKVGRNGQGRVPLLQEAARIPAQLGADVRAPPHEERFQLVLVAGFKSMGKLVPEPAPREGAGHHFAQVGNALEIRYGQCVYDAWDGSRLQSGSRRPRGGRRALGRPDLTQPCRAIHLRYIRGVC